jgi:VWFA-related protein
MRRIVPVLASVAALTVSAAGQGQKIKVATSSVPVYVTVINTEKQLVPDLTQDDFEVLDNQKPQTITVFDNKPVPITTVVMLDTSGSMTFNLDLLKLAAEQFVLRLLPDDKARIGSFSDKIIISPTFTNNRDELVRILHNDIQFGNPTFLWDAIDESMTALKDETGRRVVLIFTDGDDETSRRTTLQTDIARAQTDEFMIYAIGLHSQIMGRTTKPAPGLRKLAEETGGGYFELTRTADLGPTFTRVADELHRQYVLGFTPQTLDGRMHKLDVKVKLPGMQVRARKSYLASKGG